MDRANRLDRVGFIRLLVEPVSLHASEPERHASRVASARLNTVERDLDDELGTHVDDVTLAGGLEPEQVLRLPQGILSVIPLNVFPSIT